MKVALGPFRRSIEHRISQVREQHRESMAAGGSETLLRSLGSVFRWRPPVLEAQFPSDFDLHLDGRGLLLVPSFFCVGAPVKYFDDDLPPTLVYPITHDPRWAVSGKDGSFTIANLPAGDYTLEAWHEKLGTQTQKVSVTDAGAKGPVEFTYGDKKL